MNSAEKVRRDADIVAARRRGISYEQIGQSFGLHADSCRRIVRAERERRPPLAPQDAEAEVAELHEIYAGAIEELAVLSATTNHPSAQVAAIKARVDFAEKRFLLQQSVGCAPTLEAVRLDVD